ncbi:MAG: hypothetical protein ABSA75_03650 [Candidatus Bathyarchaeia archaeon]|jgi:hypothetical protein
MIYREAGMMMFAVFFTGFLLLVSIVLLHQIVTLNPVNPTSVITVEFFIIFGLVSGLVASSMFTQGELRVLSRTGEFTISNESVLYASAVGLPAFLVNYFFICKPRKRFRVWRTLFHFRRILHLFSTKADSYNSLGKNKQNSRYDPLWNLHNSSKTLCPTLPY